MHQPEPPGQFKPNDQMAVYAQGDVPKQLEKSDNVSAINVIYASILYTILPTQFSKNQVDQAMKRGMNPKCGDLRNNPYI